MKQKPDTHRQKRRRLERTGRASDLGLLAEVSLSQPETITEHRERQFNKLMDSPDKENNEAANDPIRKYQLESMFFAWAKEMKERCKDISESSVRREQGLTRSDMEKWKRYLNAREQDDTTNAYDGPFLRPSAAEACFNKRIYPDIRGLA